MEIREYVKTFSAQERNAAGRSRLQWRIHTVEPFNWKLLKHGGGDMDDQSKIVSEIARILLKAKAYVVS